jgi:hypothetical protein
MQCNAETKNGYQCGNRSIKGKNTCNIESHKNQFKKSKAQIGG